jgi:hypothetical protein
LRVSSRTLSFFGERPGRPFSSKVALGIRRDYTLAVPSIANSPSCSVRFLRQSDRSSPLSEIKHILGRRSLRR